MKTPLTNQEITSIIGSYQTGCFSLPVVEGKKMFYIVPMSGGIDSFVTAYTMLALFPTTPLTFVHCDTGIEVSGTTESLDKFESITGKKIIRIGARKDMLELIEAQGNFLPSQRQRTCTQMMKTLPIKRFFNALKELHGDDAMFIQFVGLRADEPTRSGIDWEQSHIGSAYPLQALGLRKEHVNMILERIQGIPRYYTNKSRSGCQVCIFSRRSEIIDAWKQAPNILSRAANMENLPSEITTIYNSLPTTVSQITGVARNWMSYYRPSFLNNPSTSYEGKRGSNQLSTQVEDLFGASLAKRLYVAVEYHYYDNSYGMTAEPFVFFENIITYSTSLSGVKKALKHFWLHRLHTKELYESSEQELDGERQIQILELEVDNFDQEVPPKPAGGYTWQSDQKPLYAIRKTNAIIERILLTEGFYQDLKSNNPGYRKIAKAALNKLEKETSYGRILSSLKYEKPALSDLVEDLDIVDAPVSCIACSR